MAVPSMVQARLDRNAYDDSKRHHAALSERADPRGRSEAAITIR